jgi:hypothetical protein
MAASINQLNLLKKLQNDVSEADTPEQPPVTANVINSDMSEADIKKKLYEMLGQSMSQENAQIEALKAQAVKEKAYQEQMGALGKLDLRPFAQAAKGYGATNVYTPTEAPEDRTAILNKLENAVSEAQQGLTREQILALKNMMEDKRAAQLRASEEKADKNFGLRVRTSLNSSEEAKKVRAVGDLNTKIGTLIEKISKKGASLTGEDKADLDSAFQDVKVAWKDSAGLGAIQKEDADLIKQAIGDSPTTFKGLTGYALIGGKKGLTAKLEGIRKRAVTQGLQHLDSATAAFPYDEAKPILMDMSKKLEIPKTEIELLMEKAAKLEKELGGKK